MWQFDTWLLWTIVSSTPGKAFATFATFAAFKISFLYSKKKPYSAFTFNIIPPIEHTNFGILKYFDSYLYIGNKENFGTEHDSDQYLEIRYNGV